MELYVEQTVQGPHDRAGEHTAQDQSGIAQAEAGSKHRSHDGRKHDICTDGEIEHSHDHDEEKSDRTGRHHQRCLKITQKIERLTEIARSNDFEDRPGRYHQKHQHRIAQCLSGQLFVARRTCRRSHRFHLTINVGCRAKCRQATAPLLFQLHVSTFKLFFLYYFARAAASSMDRLAAV